MAIRSAPTFLFFKYSYTLFLYTTPYIAYSILLSGIYIFALEAGRKIRQANCFFILTPGKGTFSRGGQGTPRPESNTLENAALAGHPGTRAFSRA